MASLSQLLFAVAARMTVEVRPEIGMEALGTPCLRIPHPARVAEVLYEKIENRPVAGFIDSGPVLKSNVCCLLVVV